MKRWLRLGLLVFFGAVAVLLVALCVRSYLNHEMVYRITPNGTLATLGSNRGRVYFATVHPTLSYPTSAYRSPQALAKPHGWRYHRRAPSTNESVWWDLDGNVTKIAAPYGLLIGAAIGAGVIPWRS